MTVLAFSGNNDALTERTVPWRYESRDNRHLGDGEKEPDKHSLKTVGEKKAKNTPKS